MMAIFIAFGGIVAALIAGAFSFLNLVISKEQKISEFRQTWIDALRADLSQYVAAIRFLATANDAWKADGTKAVSRHEHWKHLQSSFDNASRAYSSISLRINPNDPDPPLREKNRLFLSKLREVRDSVRHDAFKKAAEASDELADLMQPILKLEWDRVKSGEDIYRWSRNAVAGLALALLAGLIATGIALTGSSPAAPANQPTKETLLGVVGPFDLGETCATRGLLATQVSAIVDRSLGATRVVVVGVADRVPVANQNDSAFGNNSGVALARARCVAGWIAEVTAERKGSVSLDVRVRDATVRSDFARAKGARDDRLVEVFQLK